MHGGHLLPAELTGVLVGVPEDACRSGARDDADGFGGAPLGIDIMLDPRIEFFGVLPDRDDIQVGVL